MDGIITILLVNWCMETWQKLTLVLMSNSFPMSTTCKHKNYGINICHLIVDVTYFTTTKLMKSLVMHMRIQTFLPFQIPGRPGLDFASMKEDYPRFPDIHDLHIEFEDQQKIMVSLVNYFIT